MLKGFVIAAAVLVSTVPAGSDQPLVIRLATMEGVSGKAFYSSVEQGFRFLGNASAQATAAVDLALAADSRTGN